MKGEKVRGDVNLWKLSAAAGILAALAAVCFLWAGNQSMAAEENSAPTAEEPLLLGYCQSDPYYEYDLQLYYLIKGLEEYGLIPRILEDGKISSDISSSQLWKYLSTLDQSQWGVQFAPEMFLSLDSGFSGIKESEKQMEELLKEQKIDMMITMGTKAGLAVKEQTETPLMNFMAADPVKAGIVDGTGFSGTPHVWAQVDPGNFTRSMEVMYDTFKPSEIGVIYADRDDAYVYSGAEELDHFCEEQQVEVSRVYVDDVFDEGEYDRYVREMRQAGETLAGSVDVFILTTSLLEKEDFPYVLEPFYEAGVPVYSINSIVDVEYGALMAVESSDYQNIGRFGADTLRKYISGTRLEKLNQVYQTAPFLVLNYTTAKRIGYRPDFDMLCSTSRIYH